MVLTIKTPVILPWPGAWSSRTSNGRHLGATLQRLGGGRSRLVRLILRWIL